MSIINSKILPAEKNTHVPEKTLTIFQVEILCLKITFYSFLPLDSGLGENEIKYLLDGFHTRDYENWIIFRNFELLSRKEINLAFDIKYVYF